MEKKTVKIGFCGFWSSFNVENNLFTNMLRRHFDVQISDDPDFVICSNRGNTFEFLKYDCVRIMFMGENISPDFTLFDYVIGFDFLSFGDRYFRLPYAFYSDDGKPFSLTPRSVPEAERLLDGKDIFCNFIYGHRSAHGMREKLFERISEYKSVLSPGSFMNNTSASGCTWAQKNDFLRRSKFTIASDSVVYPGFVTEKIVAPFIEGSIPIYFGDPNIDIDFNTDSFILCRGENDIDRVVSEIARLDSDDNAYIGMLTASPLSSPDHIEKMYGELDMFLYNIFSQDAADAGRRVKYFAAERYEDELKRMSKPSIMHNRAGIVEKLYNIKKNFNKSGKRR